MASKFRNSGQTCVCANRFFVQQSIHDAFAAKMRQAIASLRVGHGCDDGVTQGPLIDGTALEKVEQLVADATARGARALAGGRRHALGGGFYEPTLLVDVTSAMRIVREEIFGPVAPLIRFRDEHEAIELANDSEAGLAGYFFTRDHARAWRLGGALRVGMVGVNTGAISTAVAPFGGVNQSGMGREGSRHGIDEYLDLKYLCVAA
jgi:succinate-semialdehyde dehydrogenase/glutarate-semialdehyde dehydrogenase